MSIRVTLALTALGLGLVPAVGAHPAHAGAIYTGGEKGAYHSTFCPLVEGAMAKQQFDYKCTPSEGSKDNIAKVLASPADIGFAQFDVFALEKAKLSADQLLPIRTDLGRECLFMVTKNKDIKTFGEVQALAAHLRFILPPQKSGTNGTFDYLKSIDPDGIGQAANVSYAKDGDEALSLALSAEDTITLFVQFPDPKNARFAKIAEMGGHFVPVLDRAILRQSLGDEKVYYADETEVEQTRWTKSTDKIVTACTPMVLFTGLSEMIDTGTKRLDHDDLVRTLKAIPAADLQPKIGVLRQALEEDEGIFGGRRREADRRFGKGARRGQADGRSSDEEGWRTWPAGDRQGEGTFGFGEEGGGS